MVNVLPYGQSFIIEFTEVYLHNGSPFHVIHYCRSLVLKLPGIRHTSPRYTLDRSVLPHLAVLVVVLSPLQTTEVGPPS